MEIKLDVLISTCIKQRKPWPRISWVGQVSVINSLSFNCMILCTSFALGGYKNNLRKHFE